MMIISPPLCIIITFPTPLHSMNPGGSWQLLVTCWRTAVFASIGAFRSIANTFIHSLGVSTVSGTAADYSAGACIAVFGPRQYVQQLPS